MGKTRVPLCVTLQTSHGIAVHHKSSPLSVSSLWISGDRRSSGCPEITHCHPPETVAGDPGMNAEEVASSSSRVRWKIEDILSQKLGEDELIYFQLVLTL